MLGVNETYRHNDSRLKFDRSLGFELFKLTPSFDCEMVDLDCEMVVETWRGGLGFSRGEFMFFSKANCYDIRLFFS